MNWLIESFWNIVFTAFLFFVIYGLHLILKGIYNPKDNTPKTMEEYREQLWKEAEEEGNDRYMG